MSRRLGLRLVLWGVVLGVPAVLVWRCAHQPLQDPNPRVTGATLVEEAFSVRFDPGKGPGVAMRLDWADARPFAHAAYFARHGYSNLPQEPPISAAAMERSGFPHLTLTWPSLHMPETPLCLSDAGAPQNRPERASRCKGTPDFILGCRTWYFQQAGARTEGPGPFGTRTTAECIEEVNANYEVMRDLDLLDGNDRAPELARRRQWDPDLLQCEQLDRTR
jgi:hypothetical protein